MATGFLLICLLAGFLVPKAGTGAGAGYSSPEADQGEIPAPEGAQA